MATQSSQEIQFPQNVACVGGIFPPYMSLYEIKLLPTE